MKGINEWAKDLKHNESVAEKFVGVKTVSDIIAIAKKNGYEFTEKELMDFDLDSVAGGGVSVEIGSQFLGQSGTVTAEGGSVNITNHGGQELTKKNHSSKNSSNYTR